MCRSWSTRTAGPRRHRWARSSQDRLQRPSCGRGSRASASAPLGKTGALYARHSSPNSTRCRVLPQSHPRQPKDRRSSQPGVLPKQEPPRGGLRCRRPGAFRREAGGVQFRYSFFRHSAAKAIEESGTDARFPSESRHCMVGVPPLPTPLHQTRPGSSPGGEIWKVRRRNDLRRRTFFVPPVVLRTCYGNVACSCIRAL